MSGTPPKKYPSHDPDDRRDYAIPLNEYGRQLTDAEIDAGAHRDFVGGLWDQMGRLQFEFVQQAGLRPRDYLLDIGCGALRGGVHFIRFLESGHYFGIDTNASLLAAGRKELAAAGLTNKAPQIWATNSFDLKAVQHRFRFAIAISLFSHLNGNHIVACLQNVRRVLAPEGHFYASYWEAPTSAHLAPIVHPSGVVTHYDRDSYHYSWPEMQHLADLGDLHVTRIGDWNHPRGQKMLCFQL